MNKRNYNLDVLRCLAMFMVTVWHFYLRGMHLATFPEHAWGGWVEAGNYWVSQWVVIICSACVNLFVLISGYFLVSKPFNWKRVILLWLEVFFYGTVIALLFFFLRPGSLSTGNLISYLFPISSGLAGHYWFFQKYFGLVCLAPFLSVAIRELTQSQYKRLLLVMVLLGCTFTMNFPFGDLMGAGKGFSLLWFIVLFFVGGYFKRFPVRVTSRQAFIICLLVSIVVLLFVLFKAKFGHALLFEQPAYNSFGFLIAVFLFIGFKQMKETNAPWAKSLSWCTPYVFGVYLISEHPVLKNWLWKELVQWHLLADRWWFIPAMLGAVAAVFVLCVLIDYGRAWLFRAIGLERLAQWLGDRGASAVKYICGE